MLERHPGLSPESYWYRLTIHSSGNVKCEAKVNLKKTVKTWRITASAAENIYKLALEILRTIRESKKLSCKPLSFYTDYHSYRIRLKSKGNVTEEVECYMGGIPSPDKIEKLIQTLLRIANCAACN